MKKSACILYLVFLYSYACKLDHSGTDSNDDALNDTTITRISIDIDNEFQIIEGFGGFNTIHGEGNNWDVSLPEKYNLLAYDLGITVLRHELDPRFWEHEEDPFNIDAPIFGAGSISSNFQDCKELNQRGIDKFIASVWSPPAWMKTNQSTSNGGKLRIDCYDKFAEFLIGYINVFKSATGIDLYAVSIENEPNLNLPWNSCIYTPEEYKNVLKIVDQKFKKNGINTRLFGPEIFAIPQDIENWVGNIVNIDSLPDNPLDILAIHIYNSNIARNYFNSAGWQSLAETCLKYNLQLWQTETSMVYSQDWKGAMDLASTILNGLKYGKMSLWCWWALADCEAARQYALIIDGEPGQRYYAAKHFYKFIRPGAVCINTEVEDDGIQAIAFNYKSEGKIIIVIINKSVNERKVIIGMNRFYDNSNTFSSTEFEKFARLNILPNNLIKLKARSIATIVYE
jgi:glucuronoarabinoxylan endo-1,4-beta-xylanase